MHIACRLPLAHVSRAASGVVLWPARHVTNLSVSRGVLPVSKAMDGDAQQPLAAEQPVAAAEGAQQPQQQQQQPEQQCASAGQSGPAAAAAAADGSSDGVKKKVKRGVALHVGYVGTNYTGLQANRVLPGLATIEGVLEAAILKAGLIRESNFGDFRKTKWTRSSRTDKGVHSLATVVSLRVLMDDEDYLTDLEGIKYAKAINEHLPEDVCVFAVQRVNKSFNARRWCGSRTYEYHLPAHVLGLESPDGSTPEDQAKLALLREVLSKYCAYQPFHCYAGNRSQYVGQREKARKRTEKRNARKASEASLAESTTDADDAAALTAAAAEQPADGDAGSGGATAAAAAAPTATPTAAPTAATAAATAAAQAATAVARQQLDKVQSKRARAVADSEDDEGEEDDEEAAAEAAALAGAAAYSGEGPVPPELRFNQKVLFLTEPDPTDPVVKSHYRLMRHFTAGDPKPLVPGGVPCVRLEVCGDSFMLHQIRHMVGAAVAIVRGIMPRELLEVSLSAPGRVSLPLAPPHSLLLFDSLFAAFPTGYSADTPLVAKYTGEKLQLRENGLQMREDFRHRVFDAAINQLLLHPDWEMWGKRMLPRYYYAPEAVAKAVEQHREWYAGVLASRAKAAEEKAAAEAAKAAAAEAAAAAEGLESKPADAAGQVG